MTSPYDVVLSRAPLPVGAVYQDDLAAPAATHSQPSQEALSNDASLVQACLAGDPGAWHLLVERHSRLVYGVARRFGLPTADADDVFQEVFALVFEHLAELRDKTRLVFWLYTITRRECLRLTRRNSLYTELDEAVHDGGSTTSDAVEQWERERLVQQALERLDPRSRELLQALFFTDGPPRYDEVSERLGIPRGSIGPTRARLVKKLELILLDMAVDGVA